MHPDNDLPKLASCTTCRFVEDKSNYWTAVMYFQHQNGSYSRVPQMANHNTGPGLQSGGMTVYYFQPNGGIPFTTFPKGFRMIVGNPMKRRNDIPSGDTAAKAVTFRCFTANDVGAGTPGDAPDTFEFPRNPCSYGIRSNIYFPQCWDGINIDSPDHASHVAHPIGGIFSTRCPSTHPVRVPLLFIEIVWDTRPFNDRSLWPRDGSQPFVFSMGDPTGYGQHADYVFGWEGDSLERAMRQCTGGDGIPWKCPALTVQDTDAMNNCRLPNQVPEVVEGRVLPTLPGCNPIQRGPAPATMVANCNAPSTTTNAPMPTEPPVAVNPPWTVCHSGPGPNNVPIVPNCSEFPGFTGAAVAEPTAPPAIITGV
ncbi:unnamed protein product [Cyclocybe aegerita]|uniref:DUF1996 domain-containing protein n=1 Tax=Cyclocybe aegerita TaxID=1973307 RepID=A0A8S0WBZ8_CYCAE|nr:unnamed protein product [Cyclocybe aegerita]